jgi:hypothetical protein
MHYPLVRERVWVSGGQDEFIVTEADYATCIATIFRSVDRGAARRRLSFSLLFAHELSKRRKRVLPHLPSCWRFFALLDYVFIKLRFS